MDYTVFRGAGNDEAHLSDQDFRRLSEWIHANIGVCMGPEKKTLMEGRVKKRMRHLKIPSYQKYCDGEEPYAIAMFLQDYVDGTSGSDYTILATDISRTVLEKAERAVYQTETIRSVPFDLRKKYLIKSRNHRNQVVCIVPEPRVKVQLRRLNLIADEFGVPEEMDVIFCRNVMIYFDRATQEKLIRKFYRYLSPGGYLFIGHAESLNNLKTQFIYMVPTIYRKDGHCSGN